MIMAAALLWIPLIGSFLAGVLSFFGQSKMNDLAKIIPCMCIGISTVIALDLVYDVIVAKQVFQGEMVSWIPMGNYTVSWGLYVDSLSAVMVAVVTLLSLMVHIYSLGYMAHDKSIARFMSYLSLFTFFTLFLVMSDDLLQLFLGWEGVGLASYLLIGFWFQKDTANAASMKAFLTNRIGDMGMVLGIMGCFALFDTVSIPAILSKLNTNDHSVFYFGSGVSVHAYSFICGCFLVGAMAKSAQLGLHVWLPDAMEGPTPVSALIHAATMVTAGVFLLIRLSFLFEYAPAIKAGIVYIGAMTALFAGIVALFQKDIKRIIAYSTCSQLGYMFMACGISIYSAALFHLVTHAFFKALLFLSAGSVIHAMSGEQNIRKMGGVYRQIPITYTFVWIGSLALAGIPLFSGYYSKDWIIESLYMHFSNGFSLVPYAIAIIVAALTAVYSLRLIMLVFHGKLQADERVQAHIHEASLVMLIPKGILAVGAVLSGVAFMPFFNSVDYINAAYIYSAVDYSLPTIIHWLPLIVGVFGIGGTVWIYAKHRHQLSVLQQKFRRLIRVVRNGFEIDALYQRMMVASLWGAAHNIIKPIEKGIDVYGINRISASIQRFSQTIRLLQTGWVADYAIVMLVGVVMLLGYVAFISMGRGL